MALRFFLFHGSRQSFRSLNIPASITAVDAALRSPVSSTIDTPDTTLPPPISSNFLDGLADAVPRYVRIQGTPIPHPDLPTIELAMYVERLNCAGVMTVRLSFRSGMFWIYCRPPLFTCAGSAHGSCSRSGLASASLVRFLANVPVSQSAWFDRRDEDGRMRNMQDFGRCEPALNGNGGTGTH